LIETTVKTGPKNNDCKNIPIIVNIKSQNRIIKKMRKDIDTLSI